MKLPMGHTQISSKRQTYTHTKIDSQRPHTQILRERESRADRYLHTWIIRKIHTVKKTKRQKDKQTDLQ